jgi:hypothetical protein
MGQYVRDKDPGAERVKEDSNMSKEEMRELVDRIITGLDTLVDARGVQKCQLIMETLQNAVALRDAIDEIPEPRQEDCRRQEPEDAMMPEAGGQTGEEGGPNV